MNKNRKLINALLVSTMMLSGLSLDVSAADGKNVERIGGDTRIETAIKASDKAYPSKADAVVVAGWNGQVDALTGTLLASAKDAPLLMVSDKDADIESVKAQIAKLGAKTVYLLGGESAVSAKVANALDVEGVTIDRVSGKGRFATAVEVAKRSETTSTHAFITADGRNGTRLADALSAGPAAGVKNSPILLTSRDSLPEETKAALKDMGIKSVTVVGGTAAVSNDVLEALQADLGKANVGRVYGAGRIETALKIAEEFFPGAKNAVIANDGRSTNENYADALVGGYFGAKMKAPVLLTQPGALSEDVKNFLGTNSSFAYVLGATGVVSKDVETEADVAIDKKEEELKVESVSAINGVTVEVTFNQPVDKASATATNATALNDDSAVVKIGDLHLQNPTLSEDGKTLTLTSMNQANSIGATLKAIELDNAAVVIEPVQSKDDVTESTKRYVSLMTYKDEIAPTIESVEAVTNGKVAKEITVKLSEPAKTGTSVKINGAYASVNFNGKDHATITGLSLDAGKEHTIELINLEDIAGNKVVSTSATFTVSVDQVSPTAVLAQKEDNQILVTFNKKMDVSTVTSALGNGSVKNEALEAVVTGTVIEVPGSNGTQFTIPVTNNPYTSNRDSRTFNVIFKDSIKDTLGNKMEATTQKVTLTKDEAKPTATGYNVIKTTDGKVKAIEVSFNKGLEASGVADSLESGKTLHQAATIVNENGVAETTKFADYKSKAVSSGDKKIVFEAAAGAEKEIAGKYAVSFNKDIAKDLSVTGNKSDAFSFTIDFGQPEAATQFKVTSAEVTNDGAADNTTTASDNVIEVTFPVAVRGGAVANSATDLANYTLSGQPLPKGTTITLNNDQKVATITLPTEGSVAKDDLTAIFTVSNIKNTAGNKSVESYSGTVKVSDNVKPVLQNAKVLDNKTIELTYNEVMALTGTDVGSDFVIKNGNTTLGLTAAQLKASRVSGFDKKIRLTIDTKVDGVVEVGGTNAGIAAITAPTLANKTEGPVTFTVSKNTEGTLEVKNDSVVVATLDASGNGTFPFNGVEVKVTGAADTNEFTVKTTARIDETVLNLDEEITVETKDSSVIHDNSVKKNVQKKEVKVTVGK